MYAVKWTLPNTPVFTFGVFGSNRSALRAAEQFFSKAYPGATWRVARLKGVCDG
jgi:hypothetical protein